jgi:hypothetical protein
MISRFSLLTILVIVWCSNCQTQTCQSQNYIIPYDKLDEGFDIGINAVRGKDQLVHLIENPGAETAKSYILSIAPFSAPLFVMAAVTFVVFVASIIQVICFNTCSKEYPSFYV